MGPAAARTIDGNLKVRDVEEYVARKGREAVTTEDIVRAVRPQGRATVPDSVKAELLAEIKKFILSI
ncbi:Enhancer of yellow 2 transcription factor [Tetrabaena socialis]|uniref:Enhancer of yellow 2 transcription factor n=1 Tax=Tetrabaena socialis TaxID=47790 RepID=A0A2J8A205_9CHLO|nr:Enhancer of yellow 2 transcription factor [Tetrabaena socialis]|eukprot:PNH06544.1 Enhancer of yellow 2 transcription factor [Tetrabaena socialis]